MSLAETLMRTVKKVTENMRLRIITITGANLIVSADISDTIECVKEWIAMRHHIPSDQQILVFRGAVLDNERTLAEYNIKHKDSIYLTLWPPEIDANEEKMNGEKKANDDKKANADKSMSSGKEPAFSKLKWLPVKTIEGRTFTLFVAPQSTIGQVKACVANQEGVPPNRQTLIHLGRQLDDAKTLPYYGIRPESIDYLVLVVQRGVSGTKVEFDDCPPTYAESGLPTYTRVADPMLIEAAPLTYAESAPPAYAQVAASGGK